MRTSKVAIVWTLAAVLLTAPAAAAQGLPREASEFDFWIGTWRVGAGPGATDKVKRFGQGVAILETYKAGANGGWSVNVFDEATRTWTQTWYTNTGVYFQVTGKKQGDDIVLVGEFDNPQTPATELLRLSFINISRNYFEQKYETSTDNGVTWGQPSIVPFTRIK
jgi:hypothetical protein